MVRGPVFLTEGDSDLSKMMKRICAIFTKFEFQNADPKLHYNTSGTIIRFRKIMSENASSSDNLKSDAVRHRRRRRPADTYPKTDSDFSDASKTSSDADERGKRETGNRQSKSQTHQKENPRKPEKTSGSQQPVKQEARQKEVNQKDSVKQENRQPENAKPEREKKKNTPRKKSNEREGGRGKNPRSGQRPLISIITITFNASRELEPTMKSIREQSYRNFEHLIIDGASTDDTIITARLNKSPNMRIISEPDEGLYYAMNKGLRFARGNYVIFMNAGDTFHSPDSLSRFAKAAESHNADIVYGDTVIVNERREVLRPRHHSAPPSLTSRSFLKGMLICHQAMMVKKEIAPEYDLHYRFSADYDWAIKVINKSRPGKRINLHTVTTDYLDAGLTEKNKLRSLRERFSVMRHHYGARAALLAHLSFIPRALGRRLKHK